MKNRQKEAMFEYFIKGFDEKAQATLRMMFLKSQNVDEFQNKLKMEQMKKEIIDEVLARISIMFETGEALKEIKSLNDAIENLEN